jgi:hypothetical protein
MIQIWRTPARRGRAGSRCRLRQPHRRRRHHKDILRRGRGGYDHGGIRVGGRDRRHGGCRDNHTDVWVRCDCDQGEGGLAQYHGRGLIFGARRAGHHQRYRRGARYGGSGGSDRRRAGDGGRRDIKRHPDNVN